jgi:hypothetical protein
VAHTRKSSQRVNILQQANGNVSLDARSDVNVDIQIQLDMNFQASLHILVEVFEAKSCILILVVGGSRCCVTCFGDSTSCIRCLAVTWETSLFGRAICFLAGNYDIKV